MEKIIRKIENSSRRLTCWLHLSPSCQFQLSLIRLTSSFLWVPSSPMSETSPAEWGDHGRHLGTATPARLLVRGCEKCALVCGIRHEIYDLGTKSMANSVSRVDAKWYHWSSVLLLGPCLVLEEKRFWSRCQEFSASMVTNAVRCQPGKLDCWNWSRVTFCSFRHCFHAMSVELSRQNSIIKETGHVPPTTLWTSAHNSSSHG